MTKASNKQTVESLKLKATKVHYRYILVLSVLVSLAAGAVFGYFASINITSDANSRVVNSIELSVKDTEQK